MEKLSLPGKMNMGCYAQGKPILSELEEMTKDPMRYNTEFLLKLLDDNKDTEYGREHGFADVRSVEEFRRRVPITTYDDYAGYIYRMTEDGERDLITSYNVIHYAKTSGTMGNPKRIPVSDRAMGIMNRYNIQCRTAMTCDNMGFDWVDAPTLNLIESQMTYLKSGATYGAISAKVIREMGEVLSQLMTSPEEALVPDPKTNTRYLHARFALMNRDVTYVSFSFSSILLELMQYIERDWEMLVEDIRDGTIDESVKMPADVRSSVLSKIVPMPERAAELRAIFEQGFDEPVMPRIWPRIALFCGVATGGFASYYKKLTDRYAGPNVRLCYVGLNASEGLLSLPIALDDPDTVLLPDSMFYEFLPIDSDDPNDIVAMDGVEVGKTYEIIITNLSGFYRYRIRDAVKIMGMHNNTPTIQFQYRIDQTISMLGEKTTELALRNAVDRVERDLGFTVTDFSVLSDPDHEPMRYMFLMEAVRPKTLSREDIAAALDRDLCERNPSYGDKVAKGMLDRPGLEFVQPETYLLYRDLMISKGASSAQLKPPRIISNDIQKRFFMVLLDEDQS
ncbi:GH3 auxin-responsive promoter family protein [Candidatus Methanoprimaticola sp. MG2]|uniref:GH3 auxin-responsive promoter family protein n=1 Tax=Candidatus Methanoprimaticola sp. MG2 TaxID=3228838 RepID=UPI0039C614C4